MFESVWEGMPWRLTIDTYWLIYIRTFLKHGHEDGSATILFERAARGSNILTEVMYVYSTVGPWSPWSSQGPLKSPCLARPLELSYSLCRSLPRVVRNVDGV